jgi:flagellar P-ring protein precursor FlgI
VIIAALALALLAATPDHPTNAVRIKELAAVEGVRDNQLVGYGLVVGLNGTGDKRQTYFSAQTLANLLDRMGVQVAPTAMLVRNTAAVMVTSNLPPFAQPGTRIDVQVAAIGDATNLQGGLLILTPLRAADGRVFAAAQGPVLTGGFVAGRGGSQTTMNHPTAGRVPNGAIVEQAAPSALGEGELRLQLRQPDFTTAARMARAINQKLGTAAARCESAGLVRVTLPDAWRQKPVEFVAEVENISLEPDTPTRVVISEKTGTIVIGGEARIRPVSILHGNLTVEITTNYDVSQPAPLSQGQTTVTPQVDMGVKEESARSLQLKEGATVEDLVRALTSVGATPRDVIAVLQSLKAAGALEAEVEVI